MKVEYSAPAPRDIAAIRSHIAQESPRAAENVLAQIERTAAMFGRHPEAGHPTQRSGIRVISVARQPYRIFHELQRSESPRGLGVRAVSRDWRKIMVE